MSILHLPTLTFSCQAIKIERDDAGFLKVTLEGVHDDSIDANESAFERVLEKLIDARASEKIDAQDQAAIDRREVRES